MILRYKPCAQCRKVKPATTLFFNSDSRTKDGLSDICKSCERENQQKGERTEK